MIRVFIADSNTIFREGLKKVITSTSDIAIAGETGDGREGLGTLFENDCDVVLLGLALRGMGGLEVLRALKADKPGLPVLILGDSQDERHAIRILKEGAWGYLTKESAPGDFVEAIRKAALGKRYISSCLAESLIHRIETDNLEEPHERLSNREYQILQMIASSKSIKEIASNLELAHTTVSTYRTRVLEKMNMKSNGELIRYAIEHQLELLCCL